MQQGLNLQQKRTRFLEDLKRSLDAEALVRDVLGAQQIRVDGDEIVFACPLPWSLHKSGDMRPSAALNKKKLLFVCHVCGAGDVFWLIENALDIGYEEALTLLSEELIPRELTKKELLDELEELWRGEQVSYVLPTYSREILRPWHAFTTYMAARGISEGSQQKFETGLDPKHVEWLNQQPIEQPRIVLPIFFKDQLRGWSKRKVKDDQLGPKYRHSHGVPKSEILFNLDSQIGEHVIVVESPMTVIKLDTEGIKNSVATFGAHVSRTQIELLKQFDEVTILRDMDIAGQHFTEKLIEGLADHTKVWVGPDKDEGTDPADYTRSELDELLRERVPSSLW